MSRAPAFLLMWILLALSSGWGTTAAGYAQSRQASNEIGSTTDGRHVPGSRSPLQGGITETVIRMPPSDGNPTVGKATADHFLGWINEAHPRFGAYAGKMSRSQVVVVTGWLDNSARILTAFGIKHKSIRPQLLDSDVLRFTQVLIIDCPGIIPLGAQDAVRDFVRSGGFLVTTHLSLANCLEDAIPGFIESGCRDFDSVTSRETVDAEIAEFSPSLFRRVVDHGCWKLPFQNEPIAVLNPDRVRVLVRSRMFGRSYEVPGGDGILAVTFRYGSGHVLHVLGHVANHGRGSRDSIDDLSPAMGISMRQGIIANFIIEGLKERRLSTMEPSNVAPAL